MQRDTNTAPSSTAAMKQPITRGLPHPHSLPLMMPSVSRAVAAASSSAPGRSGIVRRPGARLSTSTRLESSTVAIPIGMFTRNTSRQLEAATSTPPSDGPMPAEAAAIALQSATPCARRGPGKACSTSASEAGTTIAAPSAWSTRKTTSRPSEGAIAHSSDAAVKMITPHSNRRLRPSRSAMRPAATRNAANTMLYAFRTHETLAKSASGNDFWMSGNATFTIVASMNASTAPSDATISTRSGLETRRVTTGREAAAPGTVKPAPSRNEDVLHRERLHE